MSDSKPVLSIEGITMEAIKPDKDDPGLFRAEKLFADINVQVLPGEILLLLGPSGTGKSLLTNLLLGLTTPMEPGITISKNNPQSKFQLSLDNEDSEVLAPIYPPALEGEIGIMFQSLGLFDDLTVAENFAFANDQSVEPRKGHAWLVWQKDIVNTLGLPANVLNCELGKLSGGQKQRVAFGRLLAFRPKIMIFDEPTSALDPTSTKQVVELIKKTHEENDNLLSIVITHDYENFLNIADRVWFINHRQQLENDAPPQSVEHYQKALQQPRQIGSREIAPTELLKHHACCRDLWWDTCIQRGFNIAKKTLRPQSYFWFGKFFWVMFKLLVIRSIPYNLLTGFFLGLVATYFSLHLELGDVQLASGGEVAVKSFVIPAFFREMLSGFGVVLFRALIPLFTCIFIAARSGTAITAYLSNMRDSERRQWDAMGTFGVNPNMFFFPQVLICFVIGCCLLSYCSFLVAALGSLIVALATNPLCTWYTWTATFWHHLHPQVILGIFPIFEGTAMFVLKTMCAGAAIACISFLWGTKARKSSVDTMKHLIGANIFNMVAILVIFFALLIIEVG